MQTIYDFLEKHENLSVFQSKDALGLSSVGELRRFEKGGNRFYTDGINIWPSMTTITQVLDKGPWLQKWKDELGPEEAARVLKEAGDSGSALHFMIGRIIQDGKLDFTDMFDDDESCDPFFALLKREDVHKKLLGFLKFWATMDLKVFALEAKLAHSDLPFAGTVDFIGIDQNGEYVVIDWKTGNSIWPEAEEQILGYAILAEKCYNIEVKHALIVRPDGKTVKPSYELRQVSLAGKNRVDAVCTLWKARNQIPKAEPVAYEPPVDISKEYVIDRFVKVPAHVEIKSLGKSAETIYKKLYPGMAVSVDGEKVIIRRMEKASTDGSLMFGDDMGGWADPMVIEGQWLERPDTAKDTK